METEVLKNFIVLEGLDGAGTTTQLHNVTDELIKCDKTVYKTFSIKLFMLDPFVVG